MTTDTLKKEEVTKLAKQLQKEWMEVHKTWKTPVWGYFRDKAERILEGFDFEE